MAKYQLTTEQKKRLCSMVEGLKDGSVQAEWTLGIGDGVIIMSVYGLPDKLNELWDGVPMADFADYVRCGFFTLKEGDTYTVHKERIIEACENDFDIPDTNRSGSTTNISIGGGVSGGNVNIGGTQPFQGDIHIEYNALSPSPADGARRELQELLKRLEEALKQAPPEQAEDVELVQEYANQIAQEAAKEAPSQKRLQITGESLKQAAQNLAAVAPLAVKIATTLLGIG